jgi:hypothetical protein
MICPFCQTQVTKLEKHTSRNSLTVFYYEVVKGKDGQSEVHPEALDISKNSDVNTALCAWVCGNCKKSILISSTQSIMPNEIEALIRKLDVIERK